MYIPLPLYYLFYYSIAQNKHYEQKPVVEISWNIKVKKFFAYTLEVKYINKEVGDNKMPIKNFTIKGIGFNNGSNCLIISLKEN